MEDTVAPIRQSTLYIHTVSVDRAGKTVYMRSLSNGKYHCRPSALPIYFTQANISATHSIDGLTYKGRLSDSRHVGSEDKVDSYARCEARDCEVLAVYMSVRKSRSDTKESLSASLKSLVDRYNTLRDKQHVVVLIATMIDLRGSSLYADGGTFTYEEGCDIANTIGAVGYFECSSKTFTGVRESFTHMVNIGIFNRYLYQLLELSDKNNCNLINDIFINIRRALCNEIIDSNIMKCLIKLIDHAKKINVTRSDDKRISFLLEMLAKKLGDKNCFPILTELCMNAIHSNQKFNFAKKNKNEYNLNVLPAQLREKFVIRDVEGKFSNDLDDKPHLKFF